MTFRGVHKVCDRFLHGHLHILYRWRRARARAASRWKHPQAEFDSQTNIHLLEKRKNAEVADTKPMMPSQS